MVAQYGLFIKVSRLIELWCDDVSKKEKGGVLNHLRDLPCPTNIYTKQMYITDERIDTLVV